MILKKDLKFSFNDWLKYTKMERIAEMPKFGKKPEEYVIVNNALSLMYNDYKKWIG